MTEDVTKVAVYKNYDGQVRCALLYYNTHRGAAMARRILYPEKENLFSNGEVNVDWAHPKMAPKNVVSFSLFITLIRFMHRHSA